MNILTEIKEKVLAFATEAHKGQTRWDKKIPYITHPIAVAEIARQFQDSLYLDKEHQLELYIVCILHDVLEDCDISESEVEAFLNSINPSNQLFSIDNVMIALRNITKIESDKGNYLGYILRVKRFYLSKLVKIADLMHNMSDLKKGSMLDKYQLAHYILIQGTSMAPKRTK